MGSWDFCAWHPDVNNVASYEPIAGVRLRLPVILVKSRPDDHIAVPVSPRSPR
jgi:hypothetical protein